ncbi:MAG TPA: transcription-repair coupling factor [Verrucomicrobiales bacterium]|nr:transcription-repair coupling factor [Verrucomicrobiales bacterium]
MSKNRATGSPATPLEILTGAEGFSALAQRVASAAAGNPVVLDHLAPPAQSLVLAALARAILPRRPRAILWIACRDHALQEQLAAELPAWLPARILFYPQHEALGFEGAVPDPETAAERLDVLHRAEESGRDSEQPTFVLFHHESLDETVPARGSLRQHEVQLTPGAALDPSDLAARLDAAGYDRVPQVAERGHFALRGGILDVYSWQNRHPLRIEFFDNDVDSLREFDVDTQTSTKRLSAASILLEAVSHKTSLFRDHILDGDLLAAVSCGATVPMASVHLSGAADEIDALPWWHAEPAPMGDFAAGDFILQETRRREFVDQISRWKAEGWSVHMLFNNRGEIERFHELIRDSTLPNEAIAIGEGRLAHGFILPALRLAVLSDAEIFGRYQHARAQRLLDRAARQRRSAAQLDLSDLQPGDLVVHVEYGVGRFQGLQAHQAGSETAEDTLVIEYQDGARLFVPIDHSNLVSRYVGVGRRAPKLNRLGGSAWNRARGAAEKAIRDYAGQLLRTQAERDSRSGYTHDPDSRWQWEFENSFLYRETRDQLRSIRETKEDMESARPMDRLICGDVGFGKTEIAIRAAFKAVMNGKQVCLLVPTTVLAQQHYQTFRERMSDYPIRIDLLSRYRSRANQAETLRHLASGAVDIVIGTHRLLSQDIVFHDLGLVVIDEEQRFGVRHKEQFKERFQLVDVLTLSATPIPRTLYLSLMGVKDMSLIETPPPNRLPVHTVIAAYDERLIRDAIQREIKRGGQVFFLHNRVQSIGRVRERVEQLCPGARVDIGHGQMAEEELEDVMSRFVAGEVDVLVCTTIIESGIDIPNANTILIDRADRFGLADLYQLRGRVGRSQTKAFAILMLPRDLLATTDARKRVHAIHQYRSLGSGFRIAMRDLEIRGAGNLLGTRQSGHIAAIGFDLYCRLLKSSVAALSGRPSPNPPDAALRIDFVERSEAAFLKAGDGILPAFLPGAWIEEPRLRVAAYRRLAETASLRDLKRLSREWRDRFGPLPSPAEHLLTLTEIRILAAQAGADELEVKENKFMLQRRGDYLLVEGRFPRLTGTTPRERLQNALELIRRI